MTKPIQLIPYECGVGAGRFGCENGPVALDRFGLVQRLAKSGVQAAWLRRPAEHVVPAPGALSREERRSVVMEHVQRIRADVAETVRKGLFPVTVGGDHSMAAGSIRGLAEAGGAVLETGVLWIDAHPDLNTLESSPSHSLHGVSLASLMGGDEGSFCAEFTENPVVDPAHICIYGARSIDGREPVFIREQGIRVITMQEIRERSFDETFAEALKIVKNGTKQVAVSLDIDSMSPDFPLATGTAVDKGFTPEEILLLLHRLKNECAMALFEIVEINPHIDGADVGKTLELVHKILKIALA